MDMTDSRLKNEIRRHYLEILEREPDPGGLEFYFGKIKRNELKLESLPEIFQNSPEYAMLHQKKGTLGASNAPKHTQEDKPGGKVTMEGHTIFFDPNDKVLSETFSRAEYEKATTDAVKRLVKPGMNVINIGANVGYFTLLMARLVGPSGRVFAFEPFQNTAGYLQKNVDANGYANVEVHVKAVSNKKGTADFWVGGSSTHSFLSELKTQKYPELTRVRVGTTTIDDFLRGRDTRIDFVMMDAEGSEKYILEGMHDTLQANPSMGIITEYNPYTLKLAETDGISFLNLIGSLGFSMFLIDEKDGKIKPATKDQIFAEITYPNLANLYLTKIPSLSAPQ